MGIRNLLPLDQFRIARLSDFHLPQHLAHNNFDVLVIDSHTLQSIHILNFIDDVLGERLNPF